MSASLCAHLCTVLAVYYIILRVGTIRVYMYTGRSAELKKKIKRIYSYATPEKRTGKNYIRVYYFLAAR